MTNTTTTTIDPIELLIAAGFDPADDDENEIIPERLREWMVTRFDGVMRSSAGLLCAGYYEDQLTLVLSNANGVTLDEMRFSAPDAEISPRQAAAFLAVVKAWS
jgi:hypothetical protein